jgi:hypothetical protein
MRSILFVLSGALAMLAAPTLFGGSETPGAGATNYVAQALDQLLAGVPVTVPQTTPYGCSVKYGS